MLRSLTAVVVLTVGLSIAPGAGQSTSGSRASDAVVTGGPTSIQLLQPVTPSIAAVAIERVLKAARVRYGFETPPVDPALAPVDLATISGQLIPLGGRTLADALSVISQAAPGVRWTEADGIVTVRSVADAAGVLDQGLAFYSVSDASPRAALEALVHAMDPARPKDVGFFGQGRPGVGAMTPAGAATAGRNITVTLGNATVREVLQTIAKLNGGLSWQLTYDGKIASIDTASIAFDEDGYVVTASSPASQRALQAAAKAVPFAGRPQPGGTRIPTSLPMSLQLGDMLGTYASMTGVRVGIEQLPAVEQSMRSTLTATLPQLDLSGLDAAAAVKRIVACDSRYELSESHGRFLVRPKAGAPGRLALLDQKIGQFSAVDEPFSSVIDRLGARLGAVTPRPPSNGRAGSPLARALETPVTVAVSNGATIRDTLDAVADATDWSWSFFPQLNPGSPTTLMIQWRGPSCFTSTLIRLTEDLSRRRLP